MLPARIFGMANPPANWGNAQPTPDAKAPAVAGAQHTPCALCALGGNGVGNYGAKTPTGYLHARSDSKQRRRERCRGADELLQLAADFATGVRGAVHVEVEVARLECRHLLGRELGAGRGLVRVA